VAHVKIITINTWKCDGDYRARMALLAEQLYQLKPDIIACQECFVCEEAGTDTLKFLAGQLNMNYLFANGREKRRFFEGEWLDSLSGLGILSVYPISAYDIFSLPATGEDNDRKAPQAVIILPNGMELLLTNIHLTHLKDIILRKSQAAFVAKRVASIPKNYIKLICGDFNAEPGSEEVAALIDTCKAVDTYKTGNGIEPRCSLLEAYEVGGNICVDHIFALPLPGGKYPQFINSAIVLNEPGVNGLYPSDHFGITTTLITD